MEKQLINFLILIVLIIGVSFFGFYVWNDYQEKLQEAKEEYQNCLQMCSFYFFPDEYGKLTKKQSEEGLACQKECKENYEAKKFLKSVDNFIKSH